MYKGPFPAEASPLSASSTQHIWEMLAGNRTAVLPRHARGRRIMGFGVCVYERLNTVMAPTCNWRIKIVSN